MRIQLGNGSFNFDGTIGFCELSGIMDDQVIWTVKLSELDDVSIKRCLVEMETMNFDGYLILIYCKINHSIWSKRFW